MFDDIRDSITRNIRDIKIWVTNIPEDRNYDDGRATSYGLFFVYIYGVYEATVRQIISKTITELNNSAAVVDQCSYGLYSLLFSPEYDSLYSVGNDHKWEKRWAISDKLQQNPPIHISECLFPTDGKNIRYEQLESLKKSFGIEDNVLPRNEIRGYISEMVDNRNYVAHGDKLPKEVGRQFTKTELLQRCEYISEVCTYLCDSYENYILNRKYIRQQQTTGQVS